MSALPILEWVGIALVNQALAIITRGQSVDLSCLVHVSEIGHRYDWLGGHHHHLAVGVGLIAVVAKLA
jgi:hypothetical protein